MFSLSSQTCVKVQARGFLLTTVVVLLPFCMFLAKHSKSQGGGLINKHHLNKQNSNTHLSSTGSKMYPQWGAMEEGSMLKYLSNAWWSLNSWEQLAFGGNIHLAAVVLMCHNSVGVSPPPSSVW